MIVMTSLATSLMVPKSPRSLLYRLFQSVETRRHRFHLIMKPPRSAHIKMLFDRALVRLGRVTGVKGIVGNVRADPGSRRDHRLIAYAHMIANTHSAAKPHPIAENDAAGNTDHSTENAAFAD